MFNFLDKKRFLTIISLAILILFILLWFLLKNQENYIKKNTYSNLKITLETTHTSFKQWVSSRLKVIKSVTLNKPTRENIKKLLQEEEYSNYYVLNYNRVVIESSDNEVIGNKIFLEKFRDHFLEKGFKNESVFIPQVMKEDKPYIYLGHRFEENLILFELHSNLDFNSLLDSREFSNTGEIFIFDDKGIVVSKIKNESTLIDYLSSTNPDICKYCITLRDPGGNLLQGYKPDKKWNELPLTYMAESALNNSASFSFTPYNNILGEKVYGLWIWDKEMELGIASEIRTAEILQYLDRTLYTIFTIFIVIILFIGTINIILSRLRVDKESLKAKAYEKYHALFHNSTDAIIIITPENYLIKDINNSAKYMFNLKNIDPIYYPNLTELLYNYQSSEAMEYQDIINFFKVSEKNGSGSILWNYVGYGSSVIPTSLYINKIMILDDEYLQISIRDISTKIEYDKKLYDSESRLREAQDIAKLGNWELNSETSIVELSPGAMGILGVENERVKLSSIMSLLPSDDREALKECIDNCINRDTPFNLVHELRNKSSKTIYLNTIGKPLKKENKITYVTGILQDITDLKTAEKELQIYKNHLEELVKERTIELNSAKEQLIHEKTISETLIDSLPTLYFLIDKDGFIRSYNKNFIAVTGYEENETLSLKIDTVFDNGENILNKINSDISNAGSSQFEIGINTKYSLPIPFLFSISRVDIDGDFTYIAIGSDLSDLRFAMKEIRKLSQVVEQSPTTIVITDIDGNIEYTNPAFTKVTGYQPEEVLGENPRLLKSGQKDESFYKELWDTISSGEIWRGEFINKNKEGGLFWESATISPIKNHKGEIESYLAVKEDITEKRALIDDVEASEKRYRDLFEQAGDSIVLLDSLDGEIIDFNKEAYTNMGYSKKEFSSLNINSLDSPENHVKVLEHCKRVVDKGYDTYETTLIKRDGSKISTWINSRIISIDGLAYVQSIWRDITETKKMEAELRKAKEVAEESSKTKSMFLANMSHEIRTPMNSIIGFIELALEAEETSKTITSYLNTSLESAKALLSLINDILDISKLESGKFNIEKRKFNLFNLIHSLFKLLKQTTSNKNIAVSYSISDNTPKCIVGDSVRIRQILTNLLGNAIKFTDQGYIKLDIDCNHDSIIFKVIDTGIGMTEEQKNKIFNRFTQADESTVRKYGGTGLGTTISKELVTLMNGDIHVESEVDRGSTFTFSLPLEKPDCLDRCSEYCLEYGEVSRAEIKEAGTKKYYKILMAEDIEENATLVSIRMKKNGHTLKVVDNGQKALDACFEDDFDFILMDVHMPVMDGLEATKRIRKKGNKIPVIALTASVMEEERLKCLDAGMDGVASKPIIFSDLFNTINSIIPEETGSNTPYESLEETKTGKENKNLPGIDIKGGMELWQDREVYYEALGNFKNIYGKSYSKILKLVNKELLDEASEFCHTIKGVAGNLHFTDLYKEAAKLETTLKNRSLDSYKDLIESYRSDLDIILDSLNILLNNQEKELQQTNLKSPDRVLEDIKELIILSQRGDIDDNQVTTLCSTLENTINKELLMAVKESASKFDFKELTSNLQIIEKDLSHLY